MYASTQCRSLDAPVTASAAQDDAVQIPRLDNGFICD